MTATALKQTETHQPIISQEMMNAVLFRNKVIMQELVEAADWEAILSESHAAAAEDLLKAARAICACEPQDATVNVRDDFLQAFRACVAFQNDGRPSDQMRKVIFRARAILEMYFGTTN